MERKAEAESNRGPSAYQLNALPLGQTGSQGRRGGGGGGGAVAGDLKPNDLAVSNGKEKNEDVSLVEFMYLVFTRLPGESYRRPLRSLLLYLCYVFRALISSRVC